MKFCQHKFSNVLKNVKIYRNFNEEENVEQEATEMLKMHFLKPTIALIYIKMNNIIYYPVLDQYEIS